MITANFEYCPNCGHKYETPNIFPLRCSACTAAQYQNSKPAVSLFIIQNDNILLSRRAFEPHNGELDTPGGFVEFGELPEQAAVREAKKELDIDIKITKFFGFFTGEYLPGIKVLDIVFLAEIISGTPAPHDDVAELIWKPIKDLDKPISPFTSIQQALTQLHKTYSDLTL